MKHSILMALIMVLCIPLASFGAGASARSDSGVSLETSFLPVYVYNNDVSSFNTAPGAATKSGLGLDAHINLGYVFPIGLFVGATYNSYALSTKRAAVASGDSGEDETTSKSEYGPAIGYVTGGWKFTFSYLLDGTRKVTTTNTDETGANTGKKSIGNSKMSGIQFSVGYSYALGSFFELGPTLVYRNVSYKNQSREDSGTVTYADSELYTAAVESTLTPMLSMTFKF